VDHLLREGFAVSATPVHERAELPPPAPPAPLSVAVCANCGERLGGRFCSDCGQAVQGPDRVRDIVQEWARAVVGADGVLWSTLGDLIVHPGRLTRDWWEGRRGDRMSPVRTLLTVMVAGSLVAWAEHLLVGRADADIGLLLQVFTYQVAVVAMIVIPWVMPRLLPSSRQRSTYQHVAFALYASTALGLMSCLAMAVLVFGGYAPVLVQNLALMVSPAVVPLAVAALFVHAVVHIRAAYDVSLSGAVVRTGILTVCIVVASIFASAVLAFTGVNELWMPGRDVPVARFERVATAAPS
jgi:hypothetical protein